ncbi:MAG: hypothetical protein HOI95_11170 [Chromatiales bacterium]|jgi:hypothetical protein|nr:hypothetical protein [Chromatiales bacterium]
MLFYDNLSDFVDGQTEKLQKLPSACIPEVGVILDVLGPSDDQDREGNPGRYSVTQSVSQLSIDCDGIEGDRHRGLTRASTGREAPLYKRTGVTIVNRRQLFAVSPHECELLSQRLDVKITPQLLGANLLIGREDGADFCLSDVPLGTYFVIGPADAAEPPRPPIATLIHFIRQKGCARTGRAVAAAHGDDALMQQFVTQAENQRGILCSVEYPVESPCALEPGQRVFFKFPMGNCF